MKKKQILITSYKDDLTANAVKDKLLDMGQSVTLVSPVDIPKVIFGTIEINNLGDKKVTLKSKDFFINGDTIKSIWWRRPRGFNVEADISLLQKYIETESEVFANALFKTLGDVFWVSDPEATRIANLKPLQLTVAQTIGFQIPATCITNNPESVKVFLCDNANMQFIIKPVGSSFVKLSEGPIASSKENKAIYTKIITPETLLSHLDRIAVCPFILQEAIIKDYDVRVTVVGDDVFSVAITNEKNDDPTLLDWRHMEGKKNYVNHFLPVEIAEKCIQITKKLGLRFGCIDLGYSEKNGYHFFEINPQGQWLPSEKYAGHPISTALASLLVNC